MRPKFVVVGSNEDGSVEDREGRKYEVGAENAK